MNLLKNPFQKSLQDIGCTTPFGVKLDKICTERNKSLEALNLYQRSMNFGGNSTKECPYPCQFLKFSLTPHVYRLASSHKYYERFIEFKFDGHIKVTTSSYAYQELELLAELGGYVGLFLGLSLFDLRHAVIKIFNLIMKTPPLRGRLLS